MLEIMYTLYYLWNKGPQVISDDVKRDYTIVYIHGAGHCGSTLLNLLLNAHPDVVGLSEVSTLHRNFIEKKSEPNIEELSKSPFWRGIFGEFERRFGSSLLIESNRFRMPEWQEYFSYDQDELNHLYNVDRAFYDSVADQVNTKIICDASKFLIRLHMLISSGLPIKVIHLDRDGPGVIHSYFRKGHVFKNAFRRWSISETGFLLLSHWLPRKSLHYCKYERLANNPDIELERICKFLSIDMNDQMVTDFRKIENYGIGGNRMRNAKDATISIDESWKVELSKTVRLKFWLLGGWIHWPLRLLAAIKH